MVRDPCCRPKLLSLASGTPPLPPPGSAVSGDPAVDSWTGGGQSPPPTAAPPNKARPALQVAWAT